ncbi:MAG: hypothetical protein FWF09_08385 [Bacteroidales bacterium]|nr:hypothetical protein [Bacteroidales bacterium]
MEHKSTIWGKIALVIKSKGFALTLAFLSLILTGYFAYQQNKTLKENTALLNRVDKGISTVPIPDFPKNISKIITFIKDEFNERKDKPNSITLEIYTDFIGYGVASDNKQFNEYLNTLIGLKGKQNIVWYYYNEKLRGKQNTAQFKAYKGNKKEIEDYVKKCMLNVHTRENCQGVCSFNTGGCIPEGKREKQTCFLIRDLDKKIFHKDTKDEEKYDLLLNASKSLQETSIDLAYNDLKICDTLGVEFPFFAWFILEKNDNDEIVPKSAIITFPAYGEKATEKGFKTHNSELVHVLYETMLDKTGQVAKKEILKKR